MLKQLNEQRGKSMNCKNDIDIFMTTSQFNYHTTQTEKNNHKIQETDLL